VVVELEIRLLRYFVAVAEELHFTRAAGRLYVAQQALSREIRRLEERAGVPLFDRTTRSVTLTPAGERLLVRARELIALHDETVRELRGVPDSVVVDVVGHGLTPELVLTAVRQGGETEFFAEFHGGLEQAVPLLQARRLDVTFGRWPGQGIPGLEHRLVRLERLAVLLPQDHRLAALEAVPLGLVRAADVCWRAGTHVSAEWEQAVQQLLPDTDATSSHPRVRDQHEVILHLRQRNAPILTLSSQPVPAGAVLRPLVEPVATFPWSMIWRPDLDHPGLRELHRAVDELSSAGNWLDLPDGAWLPEPEMTELAR
jgi:DNA-binding transcriptional LysR family regulator